MWRVLAQAAFCALASATAVAQDVQGDSDTESVLLLATEARLHLGAEDSPWEARVAAYYRRDENLSRFGGHFAAAELLYHFSKAGSLSAQAFYLNLTEGRDASLLRLEWQRLWTAPRLVPMVRATAERLTVEESTGGERLLLSYRYRLRAGLLPALNDRLRAILMAETFVHQRAGAFREHRGYAGVQVHLAEHVDLNLVYVARHRDFGPIRWQHTGFVGVVYEGVIAGKEEARVGGSD